MAFRAWLLSLAVLLVAADAAAQSGSLVEARYDTYRMNLGRFFETLSAWVEVEAPALRSTLAPPTAVPHGYQILPALIPDSPRRVAPSRLTVSRFSWSRTDSRIQVESARLDALKARFDDERGRLEPLAVVEEYNKLVAGQKLIDAWIQYNRLWQGEIVRYPEIYRALNTLQESALERQALLDALPVGDARIEADLFARAEQLSRRLQEAIRKFPTPDYVRIHRPTPHRWLLHVPVYTDITDAGFVERVRAAIEDAWMVRDGHDDFRVALEIHHVSPNELYADGRAPVYGQDLDLAAHLQRFPPGGVVLTTGATATYASGRSIILGPHGIGPSVLVHEFGHMLGFKDGYFRGYRDLGADGYEVIEVILPPGDIVAAPEDGRVVREHFEQILRETGR